jgi:hypothetical protein
VISICSILAVAVPLCAGPTLNGWDTDKIYVIRTETYGEGEEFGLPRNSIQVLTEALDITTHNRFGTILVSNEKQPKTFTFSNSRFAGAHSPAGARMFLAEPYHFGDGIIKDIQCYEYNASAQLVRRFYLGGAFGAGNGQLVDGDPNSFVSAGCLRYNPKKDTLVFSATLVTNGGATVKGKVFEFAIPDWVADNGVAAHQVTKIQVYEPPAGHILAQNKPLNIDFDNDGIMYLTGQTFNANGVGANQKSDVIKTSTLGLTDGGTTIISITGANAGNLLIEGSFETQAPVGPDYDNVYTRGVRTSTNSLLLFTRTQDAVDEPTLEYSLINHSGNGNLAYMTTLSAEASNQNVYAVQRDYESGAMFNACWRGEGVGGGPKRINVNNTVGVIGWKGWDVVSPPPYPTVPVTADHDGDGDVDLSDFAYFQTCLTGYITIENLLCRSVDFNHDNAVDTLDLLAFLQCLNGANKPPGC